jgi:hypothetical protein
MAAAEAAGTIPQPPRLPPDRPELASVVAADSRAPGIRQPRNPISRSRIEVVISRSVAGVAVVFSLQAVPALLQQMPLRLPVMAVAMPLALAIGITAVAVTAITKLGVRIATGIVAIVYFAALVAWPFLMRDPSAVLDGKPWLWYVCSVATSCAAIAFPVGWACAYTFAAPLAYGIVRSLPSGGDADALLASLDTVYATLLGQVILIMIFMLRQTAASVDAAQTNALNRYATAVRQHATEVERVQVDSIVHDSVLATFLAAAAAASPKAAQLASGMATDALMRLTDAASTPAADDSTVSFVELAGQIRLAASRLARPFTIVENSIARLIVPTHVSEAILAGAVQAMTNSVQHAWSGPGVAEPERVLTMSANSQGGCTVTVFDSGVGFDPGLVPSERLGLRISITERVHSVGGLVTVCSSPGQGTTITIEWRPKAGVSLA